MTQGTQIINNGASLKIITNGIPRNILKNQIHEISVLNSTIIKIDIGQGSLHNIFIPHAEVTNPVTSSPDALVEAINAMLASAFGGIATEENQKREISELEHINTALLFNEPLISDETVPKTIYKGFAAPGSKTNAAVWAIDKIVNRDGIIYHLWADGNKNFDNVWDDRQRCDYKEIPEIQPA